MSLMASLGVENGEEPQTAEAGTKFGSELFAPTSEGVFGLTASFSTVLLGGGEALEMSIAGDDSRRDFGDTIESFCTTT